MTTPEDSTGRQGPVRAARGGRLLRRLALFTLVAGLVVGGALTGLGLLAAMAPRPVVMPVWALAEIETRMTRALAARGGAGLSVSVGGVAADVAGGAPRLVLSDLRLAGGDGALRLRLPRVEARFDPAALARWRLGVTAVTAPGAEIRLVRDRGGRLDVMLGEGSARFGPAELAAALRALLAVPELAGTVELAATDATVLFEDRLSGDVFAARDGTLRLSRGAGGAVRLEAALAHAGGAGQAMLRLDFAPEGAARLDAAVAGLATGELARLVPALGWLAPVEAPLSGTLQAGLAPDGTATVLAGRLALARGRILPGGGGPPVPIERAELAFSHDAATGRIAIERLALHSPTLRLAAAGHVTPEGPADALPEAFAAALTLRDVQVDPAGVFAAPVRFAAGELALRLRPAPFAVEMSHLMLAGEGQSIVAQGRLKTAGPGLEPGLEAALDVAIDRIAADRLLGLWPLGFAPYTRGWLVENLLAGTLTDFALALRRAPGAAAAVTLDYGFADAAIRFLPTLPPITGAAGRARLAERALRLVFEAGQVEAPAGGPIDLAGTAFRIGDVIRLPAIAEVTVAAAGRIPAVLSLLNLPPYGFVGAAGREPDLAEGRARLRAEVRLPLLARIAPGDIAFAVEGTLEDVTSTRLIPGRAFAAERLAVAADRNGIAIGGPLRLDGVAAEATWRQPLAPGGLPAARVQGWIDLSPAFAAAFLPGLPRDALAGTGRAEIDITLPRAAPPRLRLASDLAGLALRIPALGWAKPAAARGTLAFEAGLGPGPAVGRLRLETAGLAATGAAHLAPGGRFERLVLDRLRVGDWLDAAATVAPGGAVTLSGGRLDLRSLPAGLVTAGGPAGTVAALPPVTVALDRVQVTDRIALTGVAGTVDARRGRGSRLAARLNDKVPLAVTIEPRRDGLALRVQSEDAGATLAAAGLFAGARGGRFDLVATPRAGGLDARIEMGAFRVFGLPVLAELLNAISIVGLIDQLANAGLPFAHAAANLRLEGGVLTVTDGLAEGPSFGVTLGGRYDIAADRLEMEGVISPFYIVNAIGQVLARPGEGMFGFTYRLSGPAARPQVWVNPLSLLAPGFLRNAFRAEPPGAAGAQGAAGAPPPAAAEIQRHGPGDR